MAKKQTEKGEAKANLYLLAIVAIVGIVGIVIMILNSGTGSISISESDLTGQATGICPKANTNGCSGTWTYVRSEGICTCITATQVSGGTGTMASDSERCPRLCCSGDSPCTRWSECYGSC